MLVAGVFLILVGAPMLSEGMSLDGVVYASISRNMAEGIGSFWSPHYTQSIGSVFQSHPPLSFGMEALLFRLLGDHLYVEKLYSLLMLLLSGLLIALIWKRTTNNLRWAWLPLLFWLSIPLVSWSAVNNMLENTMAVFVLLSVYLMILSYQRFNKVWLFLSALPLLLAFLTKGFTGLFPIVFPILYCAFSTHYRWIQGPIDTFLLLFTIAVLAGGMFLVFPDSYPYLKTYFQVQVLEGSLHEPTVASRFYIVLRLLQELIVPLLLVAVVFFVRRGTKDHVKVFEFPYDKPMVMVFLLLGLSGVLPIMVSVKQSGFYMVSAFPFFALGLSFLVLSTTNRLLLKTKPVVRVWMTVFSCCVVLTGLVLSVTSIGSYSRDAALIEEVKHHLAEMNGEEVIEISPEMYSQWDRHAYYMRYGKVSLLPVSPISNY